MKLSRFYLRQNLEPLGEVSLCVGSLPTGLESSKYGTLITDMLGKSKCRHAVFYFSVLSFCKIVTNCLQIVFLQETITIDKS